MLAAKEGRLDDIPSDIFLRYYNVVRCIAKDYASLPVDLEPGVLKAFWYWGKSGRGKSRAAYFRFPKAYRKISNNKWWDGYRNQEEVILDDLDKKHDYMVYNLKIWSDIYAFVAETKGSSMMIRPKVVVVTSNYYPKDIWSEESDLEPILRRFDVTEFCFRGEQAKRPYESKTEFTENGKLREMEEIEEKKDDDMLDFGLLLDP